MKSAALAFVGALAGFAFGDEAPTNDVLRTHAPEARSALSRLSVRFAPEFRSTYISLGKLMEDRPMQVTGLRLAYDLGDFGKIGVRNWDVSSMTDRRHDAHRHALYHTEIGPTWEHDLRISDEWRLHNDFTTSCTFYRGFENPDSNRTYWWWQNEPALVNPYLTPFCRFRRCVYPIDYLYCQIGVRRRFDLGKGFYVTPGILAEGGNRRNQNRVFGRRADGESVRAGFHAFTPRLELGWTVNAHLTFFAWVEQYEVFGSARRVNADYAYRCAHNDWTYGGFGLRASF